MRPDPAHAEARSRAVSGEELVELARVAGRAGARGRRLRLGVPSFDIHGELALALALRVAEHARRGDVAGVVVTHGTDTMEETVYLVDRLLDASTPVVLTGAQRGADQADADGPRNFRDAVRAAASRRPRGRGAMIAFAGELHAAREARKVHTSAVRAFASPGYGPIGHVDGERVVFAPARAAPAARRSGRARARST